MAIDYFSYGHPLTGFRSRFAMKARQRMFDLFMDVMQPTPETSILDVGVTPDTSLPESNFFERLYPWKERITAAGIEDAGFMEQEFPGLRFIQVRRGELPFADGEFDILFCSAVVEHVGDHNAQRLFIEEALRVSKRFFFTTPNRLFPVDFHTFLPLLHWLPMQLHHSILKSLGLNFWASVNNLNLLSPGKFRALFPACSLLRVHKFRLLGMSSNIAIYGQK